MRASLTAPCEVTSSLASATRASEPILAIWAAFVSKIGIPTSSTLTAELLDRTHFATHTQARHAIGEYIDGFYNIERRHSTLGYLSPIEFELRSISTAHAA